MNEIVYCSFCPDERAYICLLPNTKECQINYPLGCCELCFKTAKHLVRPYSYDPTFTHYGTNGYKKNTLYYGIELELERKYADLSGTYRDIILALPEFVYCKADSSLENGIEFVFHPMTYDYLHKNKVHEKVLNTLSSAFNAFYNNTCDIHIHLSKSAFTTFHLYKFMRFIYQHKSFCYFIGQKTLDNTNPARTRKLFTQTKCKLLYKAYDKHNDRQDRYTAVNLNRHYTVEIRIFKSCLTPYIFWKNIEFCQALYEHTQQSGYKDAISLSKFRKFIKINRQKFPALYKYINQTVYEIGSEIWTSEMRV